MVLIGEEDTSDIFEQVENVTGKIQMSKEHIATNNDTMYEIVDARQRDKTTKIIRENDGRLLELHVPLLYDILSRLPVKTLFSCICVCKTLPKFQTDPYFAQLHLSKAPDGDRFLILQGMSNASNIFCINFFDFERLYDPGLWNKNRHAWNSHLWKTLALPTNISKSKFAKATIVGSCNGLVCLNYYLSGQRNIMCVCNPILGEFMVLPQPCSYALYSAFGYCRESKQYKVFRFTSSSICEIHTLGTDHWIKIDNVPNPSVLTCIDFPYFNGNIHWITENSQVSENFRVSKICSFDLETEQYEYISLPAHFTTKRNRMTLIQAGLLGGFFCISYMLDNFEFEVCVMKNYGVESSWTKVITFCMGFKYRLLTRSTSHLYFRLTCNDLCGITLLNNGDMLFTYLNGALVYYSPQKEGVTDLIGLSAEKEHQGMAKGVYNALEFVPSFISPKNIGKDGKVQVLHPEKL